MEKIFDAARNSRCTKPLLRFEHRQYYAIYQGLTIKLFERDVWLLSVATQNGSPSSCFCHTCITSSWLGTRNPFIKPMGKLLEKILQGQRR